MYKRKLNKQLLPTPASYYKREFPSMKIKLEKVNVKCPFHDDKTPSLNLNMINGRFYCFACCAKGGDIIDFHMQRYGFNFIETVNFFGAWSYE
tara:strand:- start:5210 stop:5488 length:279 start_codon:yes stop_codon:yes gene_type:complete